MKIKTINRSEEDFTRERAQDLQKVHRNYDPNIHQFQKAHEYTRALNAAKLDRVFARPFLCQLGHGGPRVSPPLDQRFADSSPTKSRFPGY